MGTFLEVVVPPSFSGDVIVQSQQTNVSILSLHTSVQSIIRVLIPYSQVTSTGNTIISNLPPVSSVPRYTMPEATYETLPETVLAYKRSHKIGRFDPAAPEIQERKVKEMWNEVEQRSTSQSPAPPGESLNRSSGVKAGARCRLAEDTTRRGSVAFVGPISSLPGPSGAPWIGIALDEPTGKNDGSIKGERYFQCEKNRGIFVRADRVEVGDWGELGLEEEDPDMEEI